LREESKTKVAVFLIVVALLLYNTSSPKSIRADFTGSVEEELPDIVFTPTLESLAAELKGDDEITTTKNVLGYVANNIMYDPEVTIAYCFTETADKVYETKSGDCVSMTRLSTALLRLNDIEVRTVGGCINFRYSCAPTFSIVGLDFDDIPVSDLVDEKKRGYLHEWSEAKLDGRWYILESTSGLILPIDCMAYNMHSPSTNNFNRCVISDRTFVQECRGWN
jgi:transglutaminase-like putative cysteine protease